jgi:hypothetical protein
MDRMLFMCTAATAAATMERLLLQLLCQAVSPHAQHV